MELDKIIKKVTGMYLGSAILAVIIGIITLGQPFIVFMGIGALGLISLLADAIAEYGIEAVLNAFYAERSKQESVKTLLAEIEALPITGDLKLKVKNNLQSQQTTKVEETTSEPPKTVVIEE